MNLVVGKFGRCKKGLILTMIDKDDGVGWELSIPLTIGEPLNNVIETLKHLMGELKKAKDFQDRTGGKNVN